MNTSRKIAILGASGQLGSDLVEVLAAGDRYEPVPFSREDLDVSDAGAVAQAIAPDHFAVINCAAITNVDWCEEHGAEAMEVNASGAYHVARACARAGSRNVFISTDFVFDGGKEAPYLESDEPKPLSIYGASKLVAEHVALIAAPDTLVLRISSVFGKAGSRGKGGNFVETILSRARAGQPLRVVDDTVMSPTYTKDVAEALPDLLDAGASGPVHLSNGGSCTWFEFARQALEFAGIDASIAPAASADFPRPARRPRNSALASERLEGLIGRPMPHWRAALRDYLAEKGHLAATGVASEEAS